MIGAAQPSTFALLLKRHRRAAGLTQEELAERANLSARAVGDLERGVRQPRRDTLQLLLDALELAPSEQARLEAAARATPGPGSGLLEAGNFLGAMPPSPLIGRRLEVGRIVGSVDAVVGGSGRLVLLAGEPGVGKTRLAQEVALEAARRGFLVASGRCYEPERVVPFYPFLEALATVYETAPSDVRDEIPRRWSYLGWLLPEDLLPLRAPEGSAWTSGQEKQQRLFQAVEGFVRAIAERMPVAVLLDDLHWADDVSIKLLLHLVRHMHGDRLLLLGTYRDVELGWGHPLERALVDLNRERLVDQIVIPRLDLESTGELIAATMGDIDAFSELAALVHRSTSGNPFFIQEVLRALVERGDLYQQGGRWQRRSIREIRAPESVRAAIRERLHRLRPEIQTILYEASVLGEAFSFEELQALGRHAEEELEGALEAGIGAGLLREAGISSYVFSHALTQQALYLDLTLRRRQRLHLAAGEAIHQLPQPLRERRAAELAWHFKQGGAAERAAAFAMLAGERAEAVFAYDEAEQHFRTASELMAGTPRPASEAPLRATALAKLGRVLNITDRYDEALTVLEQAAACYRAADDEESEASTVAEIGWIHYARGTEAAGIDRVRPSIDRLEGERTSPKQCGVLAALYTALARLFFGLGRYREELAAAERATGLARQVGDQTVLAVARAREGAALMTLGRREEAWTVLKDATALAESTGNLGTQSVALDNLGEIARDRGDYRQSRALCEQAVEVAEQTGVPSRIGWTLTKLGRIRLLQGEWLAARDTIERAVGLLKPGTPEGAPGGSTGPLAYLRIHLGELDLLEGNWERGVAEVNAVAAGAHSRRDRWLLRYAQRLLAEQELFQGQPAAALARLVPLLAPTAADEPQSGLLFAPLARAHLDLGEEERAESVLAEGQERLHAQGFRTAQADLLCVEGMLRASQGRRQEAKEVLEEAIELARSMPDPYREAQARAVLGSLAARLGDSTSAKDHLLEALAIAESLGARPCAARIRSALAQAGPPR